MKVLFATSEAIPYYKTGGLADVARSLPDALHGRGVDVRIITPTYRGSVVSGGVREREPDLTVAWPSAPLRTGCTLHRPGPDQAPAVLLESRTVFDAAQPYGGDALVQARRFAFFARAVVAYAARWGADVIHANDWQTGLVPVYALLDGWGGASVFAIHNLPYQGNFPPAVLRSIGVPDAFNRTENGLEFHGSVSFMKGGIALSDRIITVSPTYAREIQTPQFGAGLEGLLRFRRRSLHGILNGINPDQWDPATDRALPHAYDATDLSGKERCRASLLAELGLGDAGPLLVMVTRLAHQKGLDLLLEALPQLLESDVRFAILGDGGPEYTVPLQEWAARVPQRLAVRFEFDDRLARRLYGGGDFFLMPSVYEPCGLGQLIAHRYGTVPIVRRTGGLADTVEDGRTGFTFEEETPAALADAVLRAAGAWRARGWLPLRKKCMRLDRSWRRSARVYQQVYELARGHVSA